MSTLIRRLLPAIRQSTGKQYPALEREMIGLSEEAQRDLLRLILDLQDETDRAYARTRRYGL